MYAKLYAIFILVLSISCSCLHAQNIFPSTGAAGIGTTTPDASSLLEIKSTKKGLLIPRMTQAQRNAIVSPATGLMIYQTNATPGFYYYGGGRWKSVAAKAWNLTGNANTDSSVDFLGTTDAHPLVFRVNNTKAGYIDFNSSLANTAFGYKTLYTNTTGGYNTANGFQSLLNNTTGYSNTANGVNALFFNTTGFENNANGVGALFHNTTGFQNTANGVNALFSNTTGFENIANGANALAANTTGDYNIANGVSALFSNTTGNANTANGVNSLYSNTTGGSNNANGYYALYNNTTGYSNVAVGNYSLVNNISGTNLVAVGDSALYNQNGGFGGNTAVGSKSLYSNTTGYDNTGNGFHALYSNTYGILNTANGSYALYSNTTGSNNTANGLQALEFNTTGGNNTANGFVALFSNTTGGSNTANGYYALHSNSTGSSNTAIGYAADVTTGNLTNATAIGANAAVSASNSLVLGSNANVGIGISNPSAKLHLVTTTNNAYAGIEFSSTLTDAKNITINQGTAGKLNFTNPGVIDLVTMDFTNKFVGIGQTSPNHLLELGANDAFKPSSSTWGVLSDRRLKQNIQPFTDGLKTLMKINPVQFEYNGEGGIVKGTKGIGTIAQDLQQAAPYMVENIKTTDKDGTTGNYLGIDYHALFFILVNAVKEQQTAIDSLQSEINELRAMIASGQSITNGQPQTISLSTASLAQNVPNPYSNTTSIRYTLPSTFTSAQIMVTDNSGKVLKQANLSAPGAGVLNIDASTLLSGAYEYSLLVDGKLIATKQMILAK